MGNPPPQMKPPQGCAGFFRNRERRRFADVQAAEERAPAIDRFGGAAEHMQCLDFCRVGLARDEDDLAGIEHRLGQMRRPIGDERVSVAVQIEQIVRQRTIEKVMRFVHEDPMGQCGPAPEHGERREQRAGVLDLLLVVHMGQIDHDACLCMTERVQQLVRPRQRIGAAKRHNPWQCLERPVVPLRINHTDRIPIQNQLFGQQPGDPGLTRARIPSDKHVTAAHGEREWIAFVGMTEQQRAPHRFDDRELAAPDQLFEVRPERRL